MSVMCLLNDDEPAIKQWTSQITSAMSELVNLQDQVANLNKRVETGMRHGTIQIGLNFVDSSSEKGKSEIADCLRHIEGRKRKINDLQATAEELQYRLECDYPKSKIEPVSIRIYSLKNLARGYHQWMFQKAIYGISGPCTEEDAKLLILEFVDKKHRKFERLAAKFSGEKSEIIKYERTHIPESVRIEVWRRDQGKCAGCGSREKLEYGHIVPVSRGGSNTARNVELLCEACNRAKSNRIQ